MNKIISIIIGLVVLAAGAYWYMQNEDAKMAKSINQMPAPVEQIEIANNNYTLAQVAEHSTRDNCWLAIDGKVLNVTSFIDKHPGGEKILIGCGKESTELFNKIKAHAKSSVQALKEKFVIGTLIQ